LETSKGQIFKLSNQILPPFGFHSSIKKEKRD